MRYFRSGGLGGSGICGLANGIGGEYARTQPSVKNTVQAMASADLYLFLVVRALVSDLYCPGYNPRQSLARDSDLARTAARYKVDAAKTTAAVRAELSKAITKP